MNVIVANRYQPILDNLQIDIIKKVTGEHDVDELINMFKNFFFNRMVLDITAIKGYKDPKALQKLSIAFDVSKIILLLDDSVEVSSPEYVSNIISMGIYNFTKNLEGIMYLYNNPNGYRDVAHLHNIKEEEKKPVINNIIYETAERRIIGVKNVTKDAGATSLVYMMKRVLEKSQKVVAIEADKRDFQFFREKNLISSSNNDIAKEVTKYSEYDVILIDVNDSAVALSLCTEVLYLIEPSTIKLNRLMLTGANALTNLRDKKIILNKSVIDNKDVADFEYESKLNVFYNLPCLDDRKLDNEELNKLLNKLGFEL